jgi:GxxExxY protein
VHRALGPGFVEKIYEKALKCDFKNNGIHFENQKEIYVRYKNIELGTQRVDFFIEHDVIVELKAVSEINEIHKAQMLSYLKTVDKRVGLILNYAKATLEIKRIVNNF